MGYTTRFGCGSWSLRQQEPNLCYCLLRQHNPRPAGQTKLEKWFRDNGLLQTSQCLSGEVMELLMGFPLGWTSALLESKKEAKEESEEDMYSEAQLFPNAVQLQSQESNISQVLSSLESYAEVKDCEDIFVLPEDLGGEDLSKNEVFSLIKQVNGSVKVLPSFTKFAYNLVSNYRRSW